MLRAHGGWRLSPAFDLNPNPNPRISHATSLQGITSMAEVGSVLDAVAPAFGLNGQSAKTIREQIAAGVRDWRQVAHRHGIRDTEIGQFLRHGSWSGWSHQLKV
ncbi:MAG: HipA domain-containing protein [Propionibacteriaceae bacterium]|nr:HipA domain-containing protein [Propionibacteriaceae bacterium]